MEILGVAGDRRHVVPREAGLSLWGPDASSRHDVSGAQATIPSGVVLGWSCSSARWVVARYGFRWSRRRRTGGAMPAPSPAVLSDARPARAARLARLLAADERAQALVLLAAGRAAVEMGAQAPESPRRRPRPRARARRTGRAGRSRRRSRPRARRGPGAGAAPAEIGSLHQSSLLQPVVESEIRSPRGAVSACAARRAASCRARRGSCLSRSARTSIGTPFRARATSTRRWCGVSTSSIACCSVATSSLCSSLLVGPSPALASTLQALGLERTSRPCHARLRSFTAASSRANL